MVEVAQEDKIDKFIENPNYKLSLKQSSESNTPDQIRQVERFQTPRSRKSLTEAFSSAAASLVNSTSKITPFKLRANKNPIGRPKNTNKTNSYKLFTTEAKEKCNEYCQRSTNNNKITIKNYNNHYYNNRRFN